MGTRSPLRTEENLRAVRGTSGVAAAEPGVEGAGQLVGSDGEPVGGRSGSAHDRRQLDRRQATQPLRALPGPCAPRLR